MTVAPSRARASAMVPPRAPDAPVTMATRPASLGMALLQGELRERLLQRRAVLDAQDLRSRDRLAGEGGEGRARAHLAERPYAECGHRPHRVIPPDRTGHL